MGRRVRIFHLSDLHARSTSGPQGERAAREAPFRNRVIGSAWDNHLRELKADGIAVDLVVFTGDLGDWGHETDYAQGVDFLRRTCEALEVSLERLFVVPGNHDIARKTEEAAWRALREKMVHGGLAISEWMAGGRLLPELHDEWREALLHRQAAFWNAVTADLGRSELGPWNHRHKRLGYQAKVQLQGLRAPLWLIGLDTSWLAGDEHDTGKLWLTEHQLGLHTADPEGAELPGFRLALMHHRFADLADGERARRLLADRVDLLLHGHQHEPMAEPWTSPDHHLLVLAAGCLYEGDAQHRYLNACQLIDVDLTDDSRPTHLTVRFRGWSERNLFWGDDSLLYQNAPGGRLKLARGTQGWHVPPPTPAQAGLIDATAERASTKRAGWRREILERSLRPETFVDPVLDVLGYELPPGILSVVQMPYALRGPGGSRLALSDWASDSSVDRILVRGAVGAGKSSLLRDYHRDQCRRALEDAELPIPLLLRVRDLVDRDAIDVAAGGLRMDIEGCKFLLADPETEWLLLLDGADEHPRGWHVIESVVSQFGGPCRVIVSSRPVGVPHLSRYRIVDLEAWDEHGVEVYLSRWESQDAAPVQLLRASPAFRDLRKTLLRNPLLATLCLVVATRRRHAPSSRTDLYLGVTELLFEAWRKQRNTPQVLWHTVAPVVSEIAYRYLETGAAIESAAIVDVMRCQGMVPVTEAADEVERHLGIFIPTAEGTYDFLFRGLAEHLAAEKARGLGDERLLDLARHGWAEEVVRHAVGHAAIQSENQAIQLVRMLSCAAETAEPAYDASYLRPFLISVRVCHDLCAVAEACAQEIFYRSSASSER